MTSLKERLLGNQRRSINPPDHQVEASEPTDEAKQNFDQYLMPIFRDVAAAYKIPMWRSSTSWTGGNEPNRSGFDRTDYWGRLVWDHRTERLGRKIWNELELVIEKQHTDWYCEGLNLRLPEEYQQLIENVYNRITTGQTVGGETPKKDMSNMF